MSSGIEPILAILRSSWRFRWQALWSAWTLFLVAAIGLYLVPDKYQSQAQIYVDTTSILKPLLQGIAVSPSTENQADIVKRALLARPTIEQVARDTRLLERARTPEDRDRQATALANQIKIDGDMRQSIYQIAYSDRDPKMAQRVVKTLLDTFVSDASGADRSDAQSAQAFLKQQVGEYEERLSTAEAALAEFKKKNIGLMPDQRGDYFARLQGELAANEKLSTDLAVAMRQRDELRRKMSTTAGDGPVVVPTAGQIQAATSLDNRMQQSRQQLDDLLLKYTDKHPEVLALKDTIAQLEQRRQKELGGVRATSGSSQPGGGLAVDPVLQQLQIQLNNIDVQVAALEAQMKDSQSRVGKLRQMVTTGPEVEAELTKLNRDYGVNKEKYESMLQRLESARISDKADQSNAIKFKVLDPPRVPLRPASPRRGLLLFGAFIFSIAFGVLVAVGLSRMRTVFTSEQQLSTATGFPVLGVIAEALTPARLASVRLQNRSLALASTLFAVFVCASILLQSPGSKWVRSLLGVQ